MIEWSRASAQVFWARRYFKNTVVRFSDMETRVGHVKKQTTERNHKRSCGYRISPLPRELQAEVEIIMEWPKLKHWCKINKNRLGGEAQIQISAIIGSKLSDVMHRGEQICYIAYHWLAKYHRKCELLGTVGSKAKIVAEKSKRGFHWQNAVVHTESNEVGAAAYGSLVRSMMQW